jgi:hypothetical protein
VGVGGGVPHYTDYEQHVRLGDVVISLPQKLSGQVSLLVTVKPVRKEHCILSFLLSLARPCDECTTCNINALHISWICIILLKTSFVRFFIWNIGQVINNI